MQTDIAKDNGILCSSSPYDVLMTWGIVVWFKINCTQVRYGSLVSVGVAWSGMNGGFPPVLNVNNFVGYVIPMIVSASRLPSRSVPAASPEELSGVC